MFIRFFRQHPHHPLRSVPWRRYSDLYCNLCHGQLIDENCYICEDCKFTLCNNCVLPQRNMFYHSLHPFHPLSETPISFSDLYCDLCDGPFKYDNYYQCYPCKFSVCKECARAEIDKNKAAAALKEELEKKLTHKGHNPRHTLTLQSRPAAFHCNACQSTDEKREMFYQCDDCDFWIHKSCATLDATIDRPHYHRHPLSLVYSLPEKCYSYKYTCDVCNKRIMQPEWSYHCSNCRYFIHIKCLPNPDQLRPSTQRLEEEANNSEVLHFPMAQAFTDPLKLRFHSDEEPAEKVIDHWMHDHPLFLTVVPPQAKNNNMPTADDPITVCHCCVRPISSSPYYYSCKHDGCSFTLHKYCVELPRTLQQHPLHQQHGTLYLVKENTYFNICRACGTRCNTYLYDCRKCLFSMDVNCAFLPKIIKHEYFHKEHYLVQHTGPDWSSQCNICEQEAYGFAVYKCECDACDFELDLHCALKSPHSLPHRYCKGGHEVPLMCPPIEDHPEDFYCEICEEEMNPLTPLYYCGKCKNSFHVRCLSRVYKYENCLREGSLSAPDYHNHPLTFVRRKKPSKEVCYGCNGDINGFLFLECRTGNCTYCLCLECWKPHPD